MTEIRIVELRQDQDLQPRAMMNAVTVAEYAEDMENGAQFPPVVVFHDLDLDAYWLADGFHRVAAARQAGRTVVEADIRDGSKRDAVLYSVQANSTHGLRRSDADKRKAVLTLLEDSEWRDWSDREIARRTATSHTFVAKLRGLTGNVASERRYKTKGGTVATMNTEGIAASNQARAEEREAPEREELNWAPTWELESAINGYLDALHGKRGDADANPQARIVTVEGMLEGTGLTSLEPRLPDHYRDRDLTQALNNVAGQLRRVIERKEAREEATTRTTRTSTWPSRSIERQKTREEATARPERQPSAWAPELKPKPEAPRPDLPPPSPSKPDIIVNVRVSSEGGDLAMRRIVVSTAEAGKGPSFMVSGPLTQAHMLVDRALVNGLGGQVLGVVHDTQDHAEPEVALPAPEEEEERPFEIGDLVKWGAGRNQFGRVENYSGSGQKAYVRAHEGDLRAFPVHMLTAVEIIQEA
jgi:hypothetical protein